MRKQSFLKNCLLVLGICIAIYFLVEAILKYYEPKQLEAGLTKELVGIYKHRYNGAGTMQSNTIDGNSINCHFHIFGYTSFCPSDFDQQKVTATIKRYRHTFGEIDVVMRITSTSNQLFSQTEEEVIDYWRKTSRVKLSLCLFFLAMLIIGLFLKGN